MLDDETDGRHATRRFPSLLLSHHHHIAVPKQGLLNRNSVVQLMMVFVVSWVRSPEESGTTAVYYKSKKRTELAEKGYHIYSSVGDQWSDITGPYVGNRTFKVPNPMYFIA